MDDNSLQCHPSLCERLAYLSGSRVDQKVPSPFIHHHLSNLREGACESCKFQGLLSVLTSWVLGSRVEQKVPSPIIHHHLSKLREGHCESCRFQELPGCVDFLSLEYLPLFSRMGCFNSNEITGQYLIPIFWYVLVNKDLQHNLGSLVCIYCFASTTE